MEKGKQSITDIEVSDTSTQFFKLATEENIFEYIERGDYNVIFIGNDPKYRDFKGMDVFFAPKEIVDSIGSVAFPRKFVIDFQDSSITFQPTFKVETAFSNQSIKGIKDLAGKYISVVTDFSDCSILGAVLFMDKHMSRVIPVSFQKSSRKDEIDIFFHKISTKDLRVNLLE